MATLYQYTVVGESPDFPNGVDEERFKQEVAGSSIVTALDYMGRNGGTLDVWFKAELSSGDKDLLDALVAAHSGDPLDTNVVKVVISNELGKVMAQNDLVPHFAVTSRIGSEAIYATHNYCDPCTWYSESERVTEEALSTSDDLTYGSGHENWIDMFGGHVFDDDGLREDQVIFDPDNPHGYKVLVETSSDGGSTWDIAKQRPPFETTGGDFTVDYAAGSITFSSSQSGKQVRASYSYENGSCWILRPLAGKQLTIEKAEIQFSEDIDFSSTLVMTVYGWVEQFSPTDWNQQSPSGPLWYPTGVGAPSGSGKDGDLYYDSSTPKLYAYVTPYGWVPVDAGQAPSGYLVPLERTSYKTLAQLLDESVSLFPSFPNIGDSRAVGQPVHILQFHYGVAKLMFSSLGMEMCIGLGGYTVDDNSDFVLGPTTTPLGGTRATGTFYMPSRTDPGATLAMRELLGNGS